MKNVQERGSIDISPSDLGIVLGILEAYVPTIEVYAFGSRARWTAKEFSDLDLVLMANQALSLRKRAELVDAFQESPLPWKVDIVEWATAPDSLKRQIEKDKILIKHAMADNESWVSLRLGDCVELKSGRTPSKSNPEYWQGEIPWISAKDMKTFWIEDSEDHLTKLGEAEATVTVPAGTTLLLVRGMTLFNDIPICRNRQPATFNQDIKALLCRPNISIDYLPCLVRANKNRLLSIVDSAGPGTGRLNTEMLLSLPIRLPPLSTQNAIASILGSLDDKIDLNRKTCETLEEMARAIFKSWFVDFDPVHAKMADEKPASICARLGLTREILDLFPDKLINSELGEIPRAWGPGSLSDLTRLNTDAISPFEYPDEHFDHYSTPAYDLDGLPAKDRGHDIKSDKYIVTRNSVLVSKLNPETPRVWLPIVGESRAVCSTEFMQFVPKDQEQRLFVYSLLKSDPVQEALLCRITGSTGSRQRAQPLSVSALEVVLPHRDVIQAYCSIVAPLLATAESKRIQGRLLANLRDELLPKLISSEIEPSFSGIAR